MVGIQWSIINNSTKEERYDIYLKNDITVTVRNGQRMKCELRVPVNMNLKVG